LLLLAAAVLVVQLLAAAVLVDQSQLQVYQLLLQLQIIL
jgi:hypothetical protein|tara:strand:+ start:203 stop:319 length:117 start_codon:yes stop_codon:yes gene_type:complete